MTFISQNIIVLPDGRMDTRNAAIYCGLSVKTMAMLRCTGAGPRFVKPGRVFYYQKDLDEWLHRNTAQSTAQARMGQHAY
ncbi:MAG: hypothetical protein FWD51_02520 [Betaproteobacteria bacterium]|nr:hypothetical protein [Betaproteobacteria bacterium]